MTWRSWRRYSLLLLYFVISSGMAMLFFVIPRYAMFVLPLMLPFAAVSLLRLGGWLQRRIHDVRSPPVAAQ